MQYAEPHIKTALYDLLNEAVDGVPFREGFARDRDEQIISQGFTQTNQDNKERFNQEWTYDIEVVTKTKGTGSSKRVQELTQGVLNIILPSKKETGLQLSEVTGLQLLNIRLVNIVPLKDMEDTNIIHRRIITLGFKIHSLN